VKQVAIVVVGGSAAGLAAAITARRHYPDKRILVVRKEKQVLIPCGIPYIFGTVGNPRKNLTGRTPGRTRTSYLELVCDSEVAWSIQR
jgi:NADPH-dependent 2,4-dienoyl-CoA reductase/sulfur reductase-like enzyme